MSILPDHRGAPPRTSSAEVVCGVAHADALTRRRQLADHLARFTVHVVEDGSECDGVDPCAVLGLGNRVADELITRELRTLVASCPELARRSQNLRERTDDPKALAAVERKLETALRSRADLVDTLWPLLAPTMAVGPRGSRESRSKHAHGGRRAQMRQAIEQFAAALVLAGLIAAVVIGAVLLRNRQVGALELIDVAVIGILSFLPGWLYIRFIGQRAGAVWNEFVLNLHRLGLDEPQYLPQPLVSSEYFHPWFDHGGAMLGRHQSIYRQKFDAYYGRSASAAGQHSRVNTGNLFPLFLATVTFAIGWTAVLWTGVLAEPPASAFGALAFGFLGAYLFDIQMLVRRFFQSDLRPSAYASAVLRVVVVAIIVVVMHQLPMFADGSRAHEEAVVAFVVGLFPLVGLQALNRFVTVVLRGAVPTLDSRYPLSQLEGLNIWYQARLLEEGIEDMQNLVSANMVEVLLHTRVPVGRLVDWHDQALLYLHLRPLHKKDRKSGSAEHPRDALASFGVRGATTFLEAFPAKSDDVPGDWATPLVALKERSSDLSASAVMALSRILNNDPRLQPVRCWNAGAARGRCDEAQPRQPSRLNGGDRPAPPPGEDDNEEAA